MNRLEIWDAYLPTRAGGFLRQPALIVSAPQARTVSSMITVVPLATKHTSFQAECQVFLLNSPYCALCEQPMTIPRNHLICRHSSVEDAFDRFALNRALATHFCLTTPQGIYVQEDDLYEYS